MVEKTRRQYHELVGKKIEHIEHLEKRLQAMQDAYLGNLELLMEAYSRLESTEQLADRLQNAAAWLEFLRHGDPDHQRWLSEAITAYINDETRPEPYGQGTKEAEIERLRAEYEQYIQWAEPQITDRGELLKDIERLQAERDAARAQLPDSMQDCTIRFIKCESGHGRLMADNWIDSGCPWCRLTHCVELIGSNLSAIERGTKIPDWLANMILSRPAQPPSCKACGSTAFRTDHRGWTVCASCGQESPVSRETPEGEFPLPDPPTCKIDGCELPVSPLVGADMCADHIRERFKQLGSDVERHEHVCGCGAAFATAAECAAHMDKCCDEDRALIRAAAAEMALGPHESHKLRFSDSSLYDEICVKCGRTDQVPGGWGRLTEPCPKADSDEEPWAAASERQES